MPSRVDRSHTTSPTPNGHGLMRRAISSLVVVVSLLLVAEASAGSTTFSSPARSEFSLRSSNGYVIDLERVGRRVSLIASHRGSRFFAWASYMVRGEVSSERIDARFGKLGRISVRFRTERVRRSQLGKSCTGKAAVTRFGVFVGTIRFRGEGGYTIVDARRAHGQVSSAIRETCPFSPFGEGVRLAKIPTLPPPELWAREGRRRGFNATGFRRRDGTAASEFGASVIERRRSMRILRAVLAFGRPDAFTFTEDLYSATVRPPRPFQGEAVFERKPKGGSTSWLGTLSVSLPGREKVRLAGPRFEAELKQEFG